MLAEHHRPDADALGRALLAVLFVRAEALALDELAVTLDVPQGDLEAALEGAGAALAGTGLLLQRHQELLQLVSHPEVAWAVERALRPEVQGRLSRPALETLAIVAYRQPVTRLGIEAIRGVNCEAVLESLTRHGLVEEVGRTDTPGRPRLVGTTLRFLQVVGISSVEELPPLGGAEQEAAWLDRATRLAGSGAG